MDEKVFVLQGWKERWSDHRWMEELLECRQSCDAAKLANALLDLVVIGSEPNPQILRYLDLAIACQALPLSSFISAVHFRIKPGETLQIVSSIVTTLSNHLPSIREESDPEKPGKLPTCIMSLIEWLVYIQVDAMKQLTNEMEKHCLEVFRGCSRIIKSVYDDILLRSLAPLWGGSRWQALISAAQNIQIPLESCSDEGKKILASSLVTFIRYLENMQDNTDQHSSVSKHLFNLPCKMLLYYDTLYRSHCSTTNTVQYLQRIAKHYRCSIQKVCMEWGKAHLEIILENESCKELLMTLLLYKYPKVLSEMFTSLKQSENVVVSLFEHDILWCTVTANTNCNLPLPLLQILQQYNVISTDTYEVLKEKRSSSDMPPGSFIGNVKNAERVLREITELLNTTNYSTTTAQQIISLLENVSCNSSSFTQQFDKMFYVAVAKGELVSLVSGLCNIVDKTCDGCHSDQSEEQNRIAVFDACCLILIRCSMMFGIESFPEGANFCHWLGGHVCNPYNPLQAVLPLLHPPHPVNHQENVNMLVESFSSNRKLNITSLENVIIAFPDALRDTMIGIKSKVISDEKFNQQTSVIRNYLLSPVFVATHWLVHYKETIVEDDLKQMAMLLMKPFIKSMTAYTSTVLIVQRAELLQMNLNSTISIQDSKKNPIKKPFWVCTQDNRSEKCPGNLWQEMRNNPTLSNISKLYLSDNLPNIVHQAAVETLSLPLSGDIKHTVFISSIFLQTDPRYVPWLIQHTIPELLNEGFPSQWKSYIWALSQLAFLSVDIFMGNLSKSEKMIPSSVEHSAKKLCRQAELGSVKKLSLLNTALSVFWGEMNDMTKEEGCSYSTTFMHRFIRYGISQNKSRLGDMISCVSQDIIRNIAVHLIEHELVPDGITLLGLSGYDQTQCSAVLQTVL